MFEAPYEGRKTLCRNSWQVLKPALSYGFYVPGIDEMKSGILRGKKAQRGMGFSGSTTLIILNMS